MGETHPEATSYADSRHLTWRCRPSGGRPRLRGGAGGSQAEETSSAPSVPQVVRDVATRLARMEVGEDLARSRRCTLAPRRTVLSFEDRSGGVR